MPRTFHPFTIVSFALFSFVVAVAGRPTVQVATCVVIIVVGLIVADKSKLWKKLLFYILPVACVLVAVNRFFGTTLQEGISYALRFFLLVTPLLIVIYSIPAVRLSLALRILRLPARLHYLFLFSLEMVTLLRDILQDVRVAQQLRGLRFERQLFKRWKNIFPMLSPVLLIALSQGLERSMAIEFKGIEYGGAKTYLRTLPLAGVDKFALCTLFVLSCIVIFSRAF